MNKDLTLEVNDGIGLITFNRPEALNTFNAAIQDVWEKPTVFATKMMRCE